MTRNILIYLAVALIPFTAKAQRRAPQFNPIHPNVHDPVMARGEDGRFYIFSTGWGINVMSSAGMKEWRREDAVFKEPPQWAVDSVWRYRGHTWAPDITFHDGMWHLYYSCSSFGKNSSAIGLAVNKTLDPHSPDFMWQDRGMVIASHRHQDNYNAIDPNIVTDGEGRPWLVFGSFWDGIQLVKLSEKDFQTPTGSPVTIARRVGRKLSLAEIDDASTFTIEGGDTIEAGENAIEAPFIYQRNGWYYLFVSTDYCCRGERSTYKTVYGRSHSLCGPYLDRNGNDMAHGGGTMLFGPDSLFFGIGHCAVYDVGGTTLFLSHAYEKARDGGATLFLRQLTFNQEGWIEPKEQRNGER